MTIIYNKRTGSIKNIFSGNLQTLDVLFGAEAEDYKLIFGELVTTDDQNVMNNYGMFTVNPATKQIEIIANDYNTASV